jgi:hypothetical protein
MGESPPKVQIFTDLSKKVCTFSGNIGDVVKDEISEDVVVVVAAAVLVFKGMGRVVKGEGGGVTGKGVVTVSMSALLLFTLILGFKNAFRGLDGCCCCSGDGVGDDGCGGGGGGVGLDGLLLRDGVLLNNCAKKPPFDPNLLVAEPGPVIVGDVVVGDDDLESDPRFRDSLRRVVSFAPDEG